MTMPLDGKTSDEHTLNVKRKELETLGDQLLDKEWRDKEGAEKVENERARFDDLVKDIGVLQGKMFSIPKNHASLVEQFFPDHAIAKSAKRFKNKSLQKMLARPSVQNNPALAKNPGMFFRAVQMFNANGRLGPIGANESDPRELLSYTDDGGTVRLAMTSEVGTDGGFAAFTELRDEIYAFVVDEGEFAGLCTIIPVAGKSIEIPKLDQTQTPSSGDSAQFGGIGARWRDDNLAGPRTQPKLRQEKFEPHMLEAATEVSNTLLEDSEANGVAIESTLLDNPQLGLKPSLRWTLNHAILHGDGQGKPRGIFTHGSKVDVGRASAGSLVIGDLAKMISRLLMTAGQKYWVMNQSVIPDLVTMLDNNNSAAMVWGNINEGKPSSCLGIPIIYTPMVSNSGARQVSLIDFSFYYLAMRQEIGLDSDSTGTRFDNDQTLFRAKMRVDGKPIIDKPYTQPTGSVTVSPFVSLSN